MNWSRFQTYSESEQLAFETFCNQLFERNLRRRFQQKLADFKVINGLGGDGGIESYGQLVSGEIIAIQSKWFRSTLKESQIAQIRNSIVTALTLRPQISEYIISIPHNISSLKFGRGKKGSPKKPISESEENTIAQFEKEISKKFPLLNLVWWFEKNLDEEIQEVDNEGVHRYWFEKEVITLSYLQKKFDLNKSGWLNQKYVPELHGKGIINSEYNKLCFNISYRQLLVNRIQSTIEKIDICLLYIKKFLDTNVADIEVEEQLTNLSSNLNEFVQENIKLKVAVENGQVNYTITKIDEISPWELIQKLSLVEPTNLQKNVLPRLVNQLNLIFRTHLSEYLEGFQQDINQVSKLIVGGPGTGKTHGLANCVENHLSNGQPAIIIRAKGTPCNNWTSILTSGLELQNWQKEEILAALEIVAIRNDRKKSNAFECEPSTVIICIDGLEEDIENQEQWLTRVREVGDIIHTYPRLRFIFSARQYFANDLREVIDQEIIALPREGDVNLYDVLPKYFSKENYNIKFEKTIEVRGLNSLLALRLFCEEYKNRTLRRDDELKTAIRDLINLKINRVEDEFNALINNKLSNTRTPVRDFLTKASEYFYTNFEIDHDQLVSLVDPILSRYLDAREIDKLIDHLVNHGLLISYEVFDEQIIRNKKITYSVAFQSVLEHVISETIYERIKKGSLNRIPPVLHEIRYYWNSETSNSYGELPVNQKIIQDIASNLLRETGKLIGENGFLDAGFDELQIIRYQLTAISQLESSDVALKFKSKIDQLFFSATVKKKYVFDYLIIPSCDRPDSPFGASYLHQTLMSMPSVFERDRLWSGYDSFEKINLPKRAENDIERYSGDLIKEEIVYLSDSDLHNQKPLILAWGLSYLDQNVRHKIRVELTRWAIKNPGEYLILLDMLFECGDPQIQEDLASISLGVAGRTKNWKSLKKLAVWAIEKVFRRIEINRNVKVRLGFRAAVERAFQLKLISPKDVSICRPKPRSNMYLLPLAMDIEIHGRLESYPIVHDLAWYVIGHSYHDFLEYPTGGDFEDGEKDNDCREGKRLMDFYRKEYDESNISCSNWAMYAAIAYIRNLGLTRKDGNTTTQARHGSKSPRYTYEEKYTWLAVHYIQGYLSDYVPLKMWDNSRVFIEDYSQITDIANPAEDIVNIDERILNIDKSINWVLKENLSEELKINNSLSESIRQWVHDEPELDFAKWIEFSDSDFHTDGDSKKYTAIYNETGLYESTKTCHTTVDIKACLIDAGGLNGLKVVVSVNPESLYFTDIFVNFHAAPRVEIYSNPSDIVWMNWIAEENNTDYFLDPTDYSEKTLLRSITRVVRNTPEGERPMMIPSKVFRKFLNITDLRENSLYDKHDEVRAFRHKAIVKGYGESQEIVLVDSALIKSALNLNNFQLVWFAELFKEQNPLNEEIKGDKHEMKSRKYLIWDENGEKKFLKFWDERFFNQRD